MDFTKYAIIISREANVINFSNRERMRFAATRREFYRTKLNIIYIFVFIHICIRKGGSQGVYFAIKYFKYSE